MTTLIALHNRWKSLKFISLLLALTCWTSLSIANTSPLAALPSLAPMIAVTGPAVVNISTKTQPSNPTSPLMQDPFYRYFFNFKQIPQRQTQSAGSGVIIDSSEGIIVTNHHVIEGADEIVVHFSDGIYTPASLIGSDEEVDIAVLKVKDKSMLQNRAELSIGNTDALQVGDYVVAIGNPFGLGQTVTTGIVSALGRSGLGIEGYENFIQTDASINPGNSGGALVNLKGELIGINTAILAPAGGNVGIGFAIPADMMKSSVTQILKYGEVKRGKIGVLIQNMTEDLASAFNMSPFQKGVLIAQVQPHSVAAEAGLKLGDIIIGLNSNPVDSVTQLRNAIGLMQIGDKIEVTYLRDGIQNKTTVIIGDKHGFNISTAKLTESVPSSIDTRLQGVNFMVNNGVVQVHKIEPGTPGSYTGLKENDLIETVNKNAVNSISELQAAIQPNAVIVLRIVRDGQALYLIIQK